jgi:hypothetical protein
MSETELWRSQLKKFGILKFLGNSQNDYQEEREIEEAVKNTSLGTRYY